MTTNDLSTNTHQALLDAAMRQFAQHGFVKTSMSDIAKAAGISRTSLYKHFSTKEDVFKTLSTRINNRVYTKVLAAAGESLPWDQRLLSIIHARVSWVYELLHSSEYGRELINEKNRMCGGDVMAENDRFASHIEEIFREHLNEQVDASAVVRVLIQAVNGVLEKAQTQQEAEQDVALLVNMFCGGFTKF